MRRASLFALLVGLALAGFAATATACLEPRGYLGISSAGPGDPVPFDITGTDPGAGYDVTAGGRGVASGIDGDGGPGEGTSGSFTMPDFGDSSRAVSVMFNVQHEGSNWQSPETIQYVPPAPAAAPSEQAGAGDATNQGPPEKSNKTSRPAAREPDKSDPKPVSAAPAAPAVASAVRPARASEPMRASEPTRASEPIRAASEVSVSNRAEQSVPDRVLDAVGSTTSVGPAKIPTAAMLTLAIVFVVGTALAAFVIYLLQTGPDPKAAIRAPAPLGHDPVEIELQEMIADEMARKLLADLGLGERPISSR
ncbi:MAG TPA: hypothetical protein VF052_09140 [Solirubrobacterales bacterium]